jgi:ribonuclease HII
MMRLALAHPGYGFERHMGYSVPEHQAALAKLGPTVHHRRSFSPVAARYLQDAEDPDQIVPAVLPL